MIIATVLVDVQLAVDKVGYDIDAHPLWMDYIRFIKSMPVCIHVWLLSHLG